MVEADNRDGAHAFYTMYMSCAEMPVNRPHNKNNALAYFKCLIQLDNMLSPFTDDVAGYEDAYTDIYGKVGELDEYNPEYVNAAYRIGGEFLALESQALQELGLLVPVDATGSDGVLSTEHKEESEDDSGEDPKSEEGDDE